MSITKEEWEILDSAFSIGLTDEIEIALRDLFALGCYLHAIGQIIAGKKAIRTALIVTKIIKRTDGLFSKLLDELPGNEDLFLNKIRPHNEFLLLLVK
jgi:hypothetical protein